MHPYIAVPATVALVWRAYSRNSLTPAGIVVAALTAVVHAIHPWSVFFALLVVFFLAGTAVTKVKHNVKAQLTLSSAGSSGGEGFLGASVIALTSAVLLPFCPVGLNPRTGKGIGDNHPGLEGGSGWGWLEKAAWVVAISLWGGLGSLLDSALGGWLQASVIDKRSGKVIEGIGGKKVLLTSSHLKQDGSKNSRRVESGISLLDNNGVNLLMAFVMSAGAGYSPIPGRRDPHAIDQVNAESNKISGCVFCVVNKDGKTLFEHASGKKGADTHAPMTLDSILWIAPCTKMLCGIAAMQLCEKGKVGLDDADGIEVVSPELRKIRVLKSVDEYGNTELVDRANRITLRMLTHTGKTVVILHHVWA
ncbi:MAG: hypothetical protein LQ337_007546 [Flavoplaca oasis]|nr:MAG: hypothetical protein LQ337_007546 [Flavoplaca oasis]